MYSVMLVDDDYPVLEFLAEDIPWTELGLRLIGVHENGLLAWEHMQREMPDILLTDIGMPKMDGLELIGKTRESGPGMRIAILSCHSEFQYAQQAMRLNVQDYLIKDTLNPEELCMLLARFKRSLDEERETDHRRTHLLQLERETSELRRTQWLRNFLEQPLLSLEDRVREARELGLLLEGEQCLPAVGFIDAYRQVKQRFHSDQTLSFAVSNVLQEVLREPPCLGIRALSFVTGPREVVLLFAYRPNLALDLNREVEHYLKRVRDLLGQVLKVGMSFLIERQCEDATVLRRRLNRLLGAEAQRFYLSPGSIAAYEEHKFSSGDPFTSYDRDGAEIGGALLEPNAEPLRTAVKRRMKQLGTERIEPEAVKDWTFKLLLDLRLKLQAAPFARSGFTPEQLHKEITAIDSVDELTEWLVSYLEGMRVLACGGSGQSGVRAEIAEACRYVMANSDKRIGLEDIAERLFMNPSYFSRLFKKETGETFIEYTTRLKMERAQELLERTDESVGRICELLGYDNPSHFIKVFKMHSGRTPAEYRRRLPAGSCRTL
ncbi:response regulator transcription factor [Saccharibacillus kuerlensis]|uniref:Uncharacterized protein n=1 Tax=Saccharibacillus kuerlensis TaxID=459527 RepID=A0ABQ2KTA2_9BACL|nr:helix-turn-helix domain-containing protein [Saccharibacillus kuerlensis]GGN92733.1 hypothetical protein GCM10010969_05570 [Saccharibacillus kuerlensis]